MKVKFDPLLHIDNLVKQIKTTIHITGSSSNPYTVAKYLSTAYNLIHQIGVYKDMWKEWRNKNETDKTWPNFKWHFAKAYAEILEDNTANHNKIKLLELFGPCQRPFTFIIIYRNWSFPLFVGCEIRCCLFDCLIIAWTPQTNIRRKVFFHLT